MTTADSSDIPQTEDTQEEHSIHTPSTALTLAPAQGTNILGHPTPNTGKMLRGIGIGIDWTTIFIGLATGWAIFAVGVFAWSILTNV